MFGTNKKIDGLTRRIADMEKHFTVRNASHLQGENQLYKELDEIKKDMKAIFNNLSNLECDEDGKCLKVREAIHLLLKELKLEPVYHSPKMEHSHWTLTKRKKSNAKQSSPKSC